MSAIYNSKIRIVKVQKTSTPEFERDNDGYGRWKITAEVIFDVYGSDQCDAEDDAREKLEDALS